MVANWRAHAQERSKVGSGHRAPKRHKWNWSQSWAYSRRKEIFYSVVREFTRASFEPRSQFCWTGFLNMVGSHSEGWTDRWYNDGDGRRHRNFLGVVVVVVVASIKDLPGFRFLGGKGHDGGEGRWRYIGFQHYPVLDVTDTHFEDQHMHVTILTLKMNTWMFRQKELRHGSHPSFRDMIVALALLTNIDNGPPPEVILY